jgi:DNA-binding TFAR19-related protein (PDSD5 family)
MHLSLAAALHTRSTVANIALVKADKARKIEDLLIMNAQRGAVPPFQCGRLGAPVDEDCYYLLLGSTHAFTGVIQGKVDETQLKAMLEQINEKTEQKVKVPRARAAKVDILTNVMTQVTVARRMNWDDSDDD